MLEKDRVNLCGKRLNIIRPRFYLSFDKADKEGNNPLLKVWMLGGNDAVSGFVQSYTGSLPDNYRHISISELSELLQEEDKDYKKRKILAEIFIDYLFERGIDLKTHRWKHGIWVSEGIRRESQDLIIFKNIDGKLEELTEAAYDTTIGHKIKEGIKLDSERFNLERLFRKYGEQNVTLKQIDKANPDLVEYLFSKEYENLPLTIQNSNFILPPDTLNRNKTDEANIWPLSLDMSLAFMPKDKKLGSFPYFKHRADIHRFIVKKFTIYPYQLACGTHVIVEDLTKRGRKKEQDKEIVQESQLEKSANSNSLFEQTKSLERVGERLSGEPEIIHDIEDYCRQTETCLIVRDQIKRILQYVPSVFPENWKSPNSFKQLSKTEKTAYTDIAKNGLTQIPGPIIQKVIELGVEYKTKREIEQNARKRV